MKGQVIKNISDTFTVLLDNETIDCKCRGKMRIDKQIPLVGDFVLIDKKTNTIESILPRTNEIIRPRVSNVTQGIIVTSLKHPDFSTNLLDKLLVELEINKIKPIICITKKDLVNEEEFKTIKLILKYYELIGYKVIYNTEITKLKKILENNVSVFMGQTGAGKSTLLNKLFKDLNLETGEVSLALGRGRHTTRHVEIIIKDKIKVLDTPGFSSLSFLNYQKENVREAFPEFKKFPCIYKDCFHLNESECKVKEAVENQKILKSRYDSYEKFIEEFRNLRW